MQDFPSSDLLEYFLQSLHVPSYYYIYVLEHESCIQAVPSFEGLVYALHFIQNPLESNISL